MVYDAFPAVPFESMLHMTIEYPSGMITFMMRGSPPLVNPPAPPGGRIIRIGYATPSTWLSTACVRFNSSRICWSFNLVKFACVYV